LKKEIPKTIDEDLRDVNTPSKELKDKLDNASLNKIKEGLMLDYLGLMQGNHNKIYGVFASVKVIFLMLTKYMSDEEINDYITFFNYVGSRLNHIFKDGFVDDEEAPEFNKLGNQLTDRIIRLNKIEGKFLNTPISKFKTDKI
jgi:predicted RNA-binding protein (virulence factor B family)